MSKLKISKAVARELLLKVQGTRQRLSVLSRTKGLGIANGTVEYINKSVEGASDAEEILYDLIDAAWPGLIKRWAEEEEKA